MNVTRRFIASPETSKNGTLDGDVKGVIFLEGKKEGKRSKGGKLEKERENAVYFRLYD